MTGPLQWTTYCELIYQDDKADGQVCEEVVSVDAERHANAPVRLRTHHGVIRLEPEQAIALASALLNAAQHHYWCAS